MTAPAMTSFVADVQLQHDIEQFYYQEAEILDSRQYRVWIELLTDDARAVKDFLGDDYPRLEAYVKGLRKGAARGRTVEEIATDAGVRTQFLQEVRAWSTGYQVPTFTRDQKTLVKLKAFLSAKLP